MPTHPYLYWEFDVTWGGPYVQAIRSGDWKLLRFQADETTWDELYDLSTDIGEYNDLSGALPRRGCAVGTANRGRAPGAGAPGRRIARRGWMLNDTGPRRDS